MAYRTTFLSSRQHIALDGLFAMAQLAPRFGVFLIPQSRLFLFRQGKELGYRQPAQERIVAA